MHPSVYQAFEGICTARNVSGRVLEIGAVADDSSLLCMESLRSVDEKIGINLNGPEEYRDFQIFEGNGNDMNCFADGYFDAVLCNAVLELFLDGCGDIEVRSVMLTPRLIGSGYKL